MTTTTSTPAVVPILRAVRPRARITLDDPRTPLVRLLSARSRRRYGTVLEPGLAMLPHPRAL